MKAKDYIKILEGAQYDPEALKKVIADLIGEISTVARMRRVKTISGLGRVIEEIRQKWIAIYKRSEGRLIKEGFDNLLMGKRILKNDGSFNSMFLYELEGKI